MKNDIFTAIYRLVLCGSKYCEMPRLIVTIELNINKINKIYLMFVAKL